MNPGLIELIAFTASAIVTLSFTILKIPSRNSQQFIVLLMVVLLFLFKRVLSGQSQLNKDSKLMGVLLFICSLFVQLLVFSTGGFYSPFLIVIHLFTLGVGFLMSLQASMLFLISSLIILVAQLRLDGTIRTFFASDPWSVVLYFLSFIAIIPLSQLLVRKYHLKEKISEFLSQQIQLTEMREESILQGLNDLVFVVNPEMRILSVNESVRRLLEKGNAEIIFRPLFEVLKMDDQNGVSVSRESLSIDKIIVDKSARIVDGFFLYPKTNSRPIAIAIQVRPIINLNGQVEQIVCVINEAKKVASEKDKAQKQLTQAKLNYEEKLGQFRQALQEKGFPELNQQLEVIHKTEEDLLTAIQLGQSSISENQTLTNLVGVCRKVIVKESDFSQSLGVHLNALLPESSLQPNAPDVITPKGNTIPFTAKADPGLAIPLDAEWFSLLLEKLIDIAILLSSDSLDRTVNVQLLPGEATITLTVTSSYRALIESEKQDLFRMYYGSLSKITNLKYGSGLEGFLAKAIATQINIPITVAEDQARSVVSFIMSFKRSAAI